jgi:Flp pilus assembly pilin Flp
LLSLFVSRGDRPAAGRQVDRLRPGIARSLAARPVELSQGKGMKNLIVRLVRETEGQDLVEYTFLCAVLALGAMTSLSMFQGSFSHQILRFRGVILGWS